MTKVEFFRHGLTRADAQAVADVLDSPFLTSGAVGRGVELQLRQFFDMPAAMLVNSWTNGAVATLLALDVGPGDEVIVPAMTFIATSNVVELLGARPVFVDVAPDTLLLQPQAVASALTPRTKAVIPVHLYGQMCDTAGLQEVLSGRPDIRVIEDAAHCFEGLRNGDSPGRYSDAAIFSFYATKNVTCGEGGAIVTRHAWLADQLVKTRLHGMSAGAADRFKAGFYRHWDMDRLGVKANLPDLLAALLPLQITSIRDRLAQRERIAAVYEEACARLGLRVPASAPGVVHARHIFPIHVDPALRDPLITALNERGISVAVNYRSVPATTYYREKYGFVPQDFPVAWQWGEGTLTLPLYPGMPDEAIAAVIAALEQSLAQLR
ncbi:MULTISPECIES: DegT/DnrJ/EryC1/StrS family aminotransferase [Ramlibacter]|uniref:DegT/DnrJ/EryC1/StrS aminotransferase family protein n=1 Tax=Ramlibacter pinisoli TaxID=2682844 RepID=A0A6N8J0N7_9BURK|nr:MULTISPECIES: DegT/DnrJ/EryC1/StrS family aminotransferase [Ramlibacter]MBA2962918.1 DegT/DnrJ/EryC1/StrS family aminotransferase [Ramlibacter sp. CGMCC 1.13660]MVQ32861.1 DegT/DnrJ/EryC1/StrS aminotransferase family protein [Ramlibacter pinisoli]